MMLARDFREPEWRCCSDRRSNHDHSRRAGFRFLADSSPRLAHSTAHRKFAGMAFLVGVAHKAERKVYYTKSLLRVQDSWLWRAKDKLRLRHLD